MVTTRSKSLSETPATPMANADVAEADRKVTTRSKSLSETPARRMANADVAEADRKVTTRSKSLSASKPVKIPSDGYDWRKYGQRQVKSPDGSRRYFKCKYSACRAKKVELCDQFNSVIEVIYKGQHKHDSPRKVILKGGKVLSAVKSLKRKSMSTHGVRVPSSLTGSPAVPATPSANADVAQADQKVTTRSKSLSASKPIKIPTDSYAWITYGLRQVKSPEGSRRYFKCKNSACNAKKVELCDQFNSVIEVVYKGQHKHDPPKKVILKVGKVITTAKSEKRKSIPTHGLKEHPSDVVHIDDSATVIAQSSLNNSPGVRVPSSFTRSPAMPATPTANADVAEADQNVTAGSKSLSASKPVKIPSDSYAWRKYGQIQVKSPEGSRSYFKCNYSACQAKKVESRDQFNSIIEVVYKGQHKHDPPKIVISKGGKVLSSAKSLKGKSISNHGLKEHSIEIAHIDGSETKQRLKRNSSESSVLRHPKKPKFIVHAAADTKVSADGYKWRKYRQKMVKGNPHPRNCYKCTFAGCTIKKHMEKVDGSSQVIITYKGLHNHDVPGASPQSKKRAYSSTTEAAKT